MFWNGEKEEEAVEEQLDVGMRGVTTRREKVAILRVSCLRSQKLALDFNLPKDQGSGSVVGFFDMTQ